MEADILYAPGDAAPVVVPRTAPRPRLLKLSPGLGGSRPRGLRWHRGRGSQALIAGTGSSGGSHRRVAHGDASSDGLRRIYDGDRGSMIVRETTNVSGAAYVHDPVFHRRRRVTRVGGGVCPFLIPRDRVQGEHFAAAADEHDSVDHCRRLFDHVAGGVGPFPTRIQGVHTVDTRRNTAGKLGLQHLAEALTQYAQRADEAKMGYLAFIDLVLSEELAVREDRRFRTGLRISKLPHHKTLDDYDFSFQPELDPRKVKDLATLSFVEAKANAALLGPPGG